ncbi:hydantoinase B/oxoprolinase family protein [Rhodophyticola sp. CCM32]|uniref:hydantoinase B/oxoprolinase family protein n=1 Tax=Rhodophyticola sp. CCM32 TaxID=2916397 RepID=UPI00143DA98C|nr:hydantoinase B/oxoprolinase family protein [Rhodophyticola sp. CCM32]
MSTANRILQLRLDGLAETMQRMLLDTAVSPVAREAADCASALFTASGELLAMSDAIPLLLGALPGQMTALLACYPPDTMREGEVYIANDPFSGGTHLPDIAVILPVFAKGQLIGFTASLLHHQDIGGMRPGSVPPDATEIFQEGLRLPPMRAGTDHVLSQEVRDLVTANSRVPGVVLADLDAQVAAARSAVQGWMRIIDDLGVGGFVEATAELLDAAEVETRAAFGALSGDEVRAVDGLDPDATLGRLDVCVALMISADGMVVDFTGSSAQVDAPINCVASGPLSAVFYAAITLLGPTALRNGGILRCLHLVLPEASVVNAATPAPVNARTNMVRAITSTVLAALAQIDPAGRPAANCGMAYVIAFSGMGADGQRFLATEIIAGGAGGGPDGAGAHAVSTDVGNARNTPVEIIEADLPLRVLSSERRRGSGGEGLHNGGDGVRRTYLALADGISVSIRGSGSSASQMDPAGVVRRNLPLRVSCAPTARRNHSARDLL